MSEEENSQISDNAYGYGTSPPDAFSQLVETYCAEFGRDRVRPYLIPIQTSKTWQPIVIEDAPSISYKSSDSNRASTSKTDKDVPVIVVCNDDTCEIENHDHSSIKNISPLSSVTSRRLEWDSLADIGYANEDQNKDSHTKPLSTLERIALNRHLKGDLTVDYKNDDICIKYKTSVGIPIAQSTPFPSANEPTKENCVPNTSKSFVSHKCKPLKTRRYRNKKLHSKSNSNRKVSYTICVDINKSQTSCERPTTNSNFPIAYTDDKHITPDSAKSDPLIKISSKSSYSTITPNQTIDIISPVTIERSEFTEQQKNSPLYDMGTNEIENISPKYDSSKISSLKSETNSSENKEGNLLNLESIDNTETSLPATIASNNYNSSNLSEVNSFEFILGSDYNKKKNQLSTSSSSRLQSDTQSSSELKSEILRKDFVQRFCSSDHDLVNSNENFFESSTFPQSNISPKSLDSIYRLVQSKHSDPDLKRRLVKKIIQLLTANYISEDNSKSSNKTTLNTKSLAKSYVDHECQTNADLIPKSAEAVKKSISSSVNNENPNTYNEKLSFESEAIHKLCQTSQNSSSSYSSTYEEYLRKKTRERLLKKEKVIKKMSDLVQEKTDLSSNQSNDPNETIKKLNTINNEILKLLIIKFKLENKQGNADFDKYLDTMLQKTSNNKSKSNSKSSECRTHKSVSLENESKSFSTQWEPKNDINVPPLNLKISSDDDEVLSDNAKQSMSHQSNNKNECDSLNIDHQPDNLSSNSKKDLSKKSTGRCDCNMYDLSKSCSYCESKLISESNSSDSKKSIEFKIDKLKESYSKYGKCHILKSFLNEYDALIAKYKNMKLPPPKQVLNYADKSQGSSRQTSISKVIVPKNNTDCMENVSDNVGKQSKISIISPTNSLSEKTSDKNKSSSNSTKKKFTSDQNVFSQANDENRENITKPKSVIKDPMIKEIFTFMEKMDKRLNENSLLRKQEVSKIDRGNQISPLPLDSGTTDSRNTLPKFKSSSKSSKIQADNYIVEYNTKNDGKSKKSSESQNRKIKTKNIENCPVCVDNHLKHSRCKNLCHCSKTLRHTKRKEYPKSVAYNLILEPSNSIMVDSNNLKSKKVLDNIVVKIPKIYCENKDRAICQLKERAAAATQLYFDSKGSTDDQLEDLSSLNNDNLSDQFNMTVETITPISSNHIFTEKENAVPDSFNEHIAKNTLTIKDYLVMNRPKFMTNADGRLKSLKNNKLIRKEYESHKRKFFEENLSNISELQKNVIFHSRYSNHDNVTIPENKKLFNAKEIIKNTTLRYKKLPEVQKQKELLKKQKQLKTNRLIAKMFVKKLQQRALNGIVNISHSSDVISL